jgi:hypothetical protein
LSSAQLTVLAAQYDKRNATWREEWLDAKPAERTERRMKQVVERAESFYGSLTDAQRKLVQTQIETSGFNPAMQFGEIQRRQQDSLRTLARLRSASLPEAQAVAEIQALISRSITSPDPVYRRYQEQMRQQGCVAIALLHNSSSPAQREKLLESFKNYAMDARTLMLQR